MGAPRRSPLGTEADRADEATTQKASSAGPDPELTPDDGAEPVGAPSAEKEPHEAAPEAVPESEDHERKLERDLEELTAKAEKADEYLELAQRTKADFENYRKRAAREAAAAQERGVVRLAKELLPAVDNLDRALQAAESAGDSDNVTATLASGIKLVHDDVIAALGR